MNVLYDAQVFSFQDYGGISRYFSELIKYFIHRQDIFPKLLVRYSNNRYLKEFSQFYSRSLFPNRKFKGKHEILKFLNRRFVRKNFESNKKTNLFHPTYYDPYFLSFIKSVPFVVTVFDMTHELYPDQFHKFDFTKRNKKIVVDKAEKIITISESTKQDIIRLYKISEDKIDVTYLAANVNFNNQLKPKVPIPNNYFLYVGKRNTYKNFLFALKAMHLLKRHSNKIALVCAGGGRFSKQEKKYIKELELNDSIVQLETTDAELASLYANAIALIYPSKYEGFGIPIIEAFSCGCPVLASNSSSLPEVGGNAAKYFNPEDLQALVSLLKELQRNNILRKEMSQLGFRRAKEFSWEQTGKATLDIYKKIVC